MLALILKILIGPLWGVFENRAWKEHGENWILGHFKTYHVLMFGLFGVINLINLPLSITGILTWVTLMLWDILSLDVAWWIIRYYDFKKDYEKAKISYGEPNPWHLRTDWDNWLGLPVYGVYWWWYVFTLLIVILSISTIFQL